MNDFLLFIADLVKRFPVHVEIEYNKTADWTILVYKTGCSEHEFQGAQRVDGEVMICLEQDLDMELCFAKAHVAVKNWLLEYWGGY